MNNNDLGISNICGYDIKRRYRLVTLMLIFSFCIAGCTYLKSDEEMIADRVQTFEEAYNNGDWEKVLNCFDSKSRNTYEAMFSVGEMFGSSLIGFDISFSDFFALGMGLVGEDEQLAIEITDIVINDKKSAIVYGTVTFNYENITSEIKLVKEKNDWFIQDMN